MVGKVSTVKARQKVKKQQKKKQLGPIKKETKKVTKIKGKCFLCGEKGHWKRNYPKSQNKKEEGNLNYLETCFLADSTDSWIIDSGATNHVCYSLQGFQERRKLSKNEINLRLGNGTIKRLVSDGPLSDLKVDDLPTCESCLEGKMTKRTFSAKGVRATECLGLIHTDVCGPMSIQARGGYEYFITFIDDYSRFGYVYLMRHKSDAFDMFKAFKAEVENQLEKHIVSMSFGHVLSRLKIKLCVVMLRRGFSAAVCDSGVRATASQCRGSSAAVMKPRQSSHRATAIV
ncbi:hypothetical protein Q3G72_018598 [Acer saccharum]|nr:hypothetical protein Q3G72_018598 [Acer saccharum]